MSVSAPLYIATQFASSIFPYFGIVGTVAEIPPISSWIVSGPLRNMPFVVADQPEPESQLKKRKKSYGEGRIGGLFKTLQAEKKRNRRKGKTTTS